jgi:hypothetical protein
MRYKYFEKLSNIDKAEFYFNNLIKCELNNHRTFKKDIINKICQLLDSITFKNGFQSNKNGIISIRKLSSSLGHLTAEWSLDWCWIIHHIWLDYRTLSKITSLRDSTRYSTDKQILVYKEYSDSLKPILNKNYFKVYDTGEPRTFTLYYLLRTKHQLSYSIKKPKVTLGATYWGIRGDMAVWDDFSVYPYDKSKIWNNETKRFDFSSLSATSCVEK